MVVPRLELIPVPLYGPNDPYHYNYDNLPLKNILRRQELINLSLDDVIEQMTDAIGTQGSVSNRLNQSINPDGSLKTSAIDEAEHSIASHTDDDTYVRMLRAESDKLALIADGATSLYIDVQVDDAGDDVVTLDTSVIRLLPSTTVTWSVDAPNVVKANFAFPVEAAHRHYYDQEPVPVNVAFPDYANYQVNSSATPYVVGSLRVYVNGIRLTASESIYVAGPLASDVWTRITYTPDEASGTFVFTPALTDEDIVRIDYDLLYE